MSEIDAALAQLFFLRGQPDRARAELAALAICRTYPKGNILYYHGDPAEAVYVVVDGRVKVSLVNEEGREVVLGVMRPGQIFGLVAVLEGGPHTGNATTLTESRIARIGRDGFLGWLERNPTFHLPLARELARLLRLAYEKVGEQALLPVKRRLRAVLLEIARSEGEPRAGDEVEFRLPTHQELAERIGSTRVVVSRVLKEILEEEEQLQAVGRVIRVPLRALVLREEF